MSSNRVILGIDPGTSILGYGVIQGVKTPEFVTMGVIHLDKIKDPFEKLTEIYRFTNQLIEQYHPDSLAIEAPFYGKNIQSMLKLGRAQGVALSAAISHGLAVAEYLPRKIKMAVTGNGNASKEQVAGMLQVLLKYGESPAYFDATDGLAVALCHFYQNRLSSSPKSYSSWKEFVGKNPKRINK